MAAPLPLAVHIIAGVPTPQVNKVLLGEAGEHLVISRLLARGILAYQAPRNWKSDDVMLESGVTIQVKTTDKKPNWLVGNVHVDPKRFYALVDLRIADAAVVYVLSSAQVYEAAEALHRAVSSAHPNYKDIGMRNIQDPWIRQPALAPYEPGWLAPYREAWGQLL